MIDCIMLCIPAEWCVTESQKVRLCFVWNFASALTNLVIALLFLSNGMCLIVMDGTSLFQFFLRGKKMQAGERAERDHTAHLRVIFLNKTSRKCLLELYFWETSPMHITTIDWHQWTICNFGCKCINRTWVQRGYSSTVDSPTTKRVRLNSLATSPAAELCRD